MKKVIAVLLAAVMIFGLCACAKKEAAPAAGSGATGIAAGGTIELGHGYGSFEAVAHDPNELYIEVSCLGNLDYFYDHKLGMEIVGKILDVKTEYVGPDDADMTKMVAAFEQSIAKKPAGIITFGAEDTLGAVIDQAIDAGIPVVTVDGDVASSKRLAFVGTGHFNAGVMGAKYLVEKLGGKGKVAILTFPGQSHLELRIDGYESILEQYPDIEIVAIGDTRSDPETAASAASAILQKYPDLDAFICVEAAGGAGAMTAVKEAGKQGKVMIMSMDRGADVLESIKEGVVTATLVQQTALMPIYAVQMLYNLNHYKVPISSDNAKAGLSGTPVNIDTGVVVCDQSNVDYFVR